jgi:predicted SAM-dependent methyltransferase
MNRRLKNFLKALPGLQGVVIRLRLIRLKIVSSYQWKQLAKKDDIKLELGSGSKKGSNGFTTIDFSGADIHRDLRNGIPLNDNSVSVIYSSHMLEHIPYSQLMPFLKECRRVLKPDGQLSVCVPNARNYIQAYIEKRHFQDMESSYKPAVVNTGSYLDQLNYMAYMDGQHCYMFDEENLVNTLRTAEYSKVALRSFDESIDIKERDFESIYAVASK